MPCVYLQLWDMSPVVSWGLWATSSSQQEALFTKLWWRLSRLEEKERSISNNIDVIWIIFNSYSTTSSGCCTFTVRSLQASEAWEQDRPWLTQGYRWLWVFVCVQGAVGWGISLCVCVCLSCIWVRGTGRGIWLCKDLTNLIYLIFMHSCRFHTGNSQNSKWNICALCQRAPSNPNFKLFRCEARHVPGAHLTLKPTHLAGCRFSTRESGLISPAHANLRHLQE